MTTERRTERHTANFTPSEIAEVERAASKARQSVPEFMRAAVLVAVENPPLSAVETAELRRLIGRVHITGITTDQEMT